MNIFEKINEARVRFQDLKIKMGGENTFSHYKYYELSDILPNLNKICKELGLNNLISFGVDLATMTITDTESLDQVRVTSPMSSAALKGCHEVQNLGAVETYIRRYLYQTAYEIIESDVLNLTHNKNEKKERFTPSDPEKDLEDIRIWLAGEVSATTHTNWDQSRKDKCLKALPRYDWDILKKLAKDLGVESDQFGIV